MTGYLYYVTLPFVSADELSDSKLSTINREAYDQLQVMVLDGEVEVVQEWQRLMERPEPHHHVSTRHEYCTPCMILAQNRERVPTPGDDEEEDDDE